jgi:glycosyltransferase involved in cell wall biosynthesis
VLAQEYTDFELVICDNASSDNTPELVCNYSDSRIRYLRFEELVNQAGSFNRCLTAARGELIAILHSDDYYLPGFIRDRVNRFDTDPSLGMVFGAVEVIDKDGKRVSTSQRWAEDQHFGHGQLLDDLVMACIVSPPSLMVRRAIVERAGEFRTDLTWGHDWEWSMRLAEHGSASYGSKPLAA